MPSYLQDPVLPTQRGRIASPSGGTDDSEAWFNTDPTPVLLLAAGGTVIDLNAAASSLLGVAPDAEISAGRLVFTNPAAQQAFLRALADVVSGLSGRTPLVLRFKDGGCRRFELNPLGTAPPHLVYLTLRSDPAAAPDVGPLSRTCGLTTQEGEVLRALAEGLSPREAADLLGISERTVRSHLRALYMKLNVRGLQDLVRFTARMAG